MHTVYTHNEFKIYYCKGEKACFSKEYCILKHVQNANKYNRNLDSEFRNVKSTKSCRPTYGCFHVNITSISLVQCEVHILLREGDWEHWDVEVLHKQSGCKNLVKISAFCTPFPHIWSMQRADDGKHNK